MIFNFSPLKMFSVRLFARILLLVSTLCILAFVLQQSEMWAIKSFLLVIAFGSALELCYFISATNRQLARFLSELQYCDGSQRMVHESEGMGFESLSSTLTKILQRVSEKQIKQEQKIATAQAQLEVVPVPIISLTENDKLTFHNRAARQLFEGILPQNASQLSEFGEQFQQDIIRLEHSQQCVSSYYYAGIKQSVLLTCSELQSDNTKTRLIAIQNIQPHLDSKEVESWQRLVTVLTHEIMNSITPIASLSNATAEIAGDMLTDVDAINAQDLGEIKSSLDRMARRSNNLLEFVQAYRKVSQVPEPKLAPTLIQPLLKDVIQLTQEEFQRQDISIATDITPDNLALNIDKNLIEQVLINLLVNAGEALSGTEKPKIFINAYVHHNGRGVIEVKDNGDGISQELLDKIFLPFFTTKKTGSGVGLALAHQVLLAHGGTIQCHSQYGMTTFLLVF